MANGDNPLLPQLADPASVRARNLTAFARSRAQAARALEDTGGPWAKVH